MPRPVKRRRPVRRGFEPLEMRLLLSGDADTAVNRLLVQFAGGGSSRAADVRAVNGPLAPGVDPLGGGLFVIDPGPKVSQAVALSQYRSLPGVLYAEPEQQAKIAATPNDPLFFQQYNLTASSGSGIDAPQAWDLTAGNPPVVEAVTDTGVDYTHPDLYLNIALNQGEIPAAIKGKLVDTNGDGLFDFHDLNSLGRDGKPVLDGSGNKVNAWATHDVNGNGYIDAGDLLRDPTWNDGVDKDHNGFAADLVGWNFVAGTNDPMDDNYHGTMVAGILGAVSNNGVGLAGVDPNARILPVKFIGSNGNGTSGGAVQSIRYAATQGARVINASWAYQLGGGDTDPITAAAINYAGSLGSVFVAAAGNTSNNNDVIPTYPGALRLPNEIVVAATDAQGNLAQSSNYGAMTVDVGAPGVNIVSTAPGGAYAQNSGTSMAAPHVTGIIGLLAAAHTDWTPQQLVQRVKDTARPLPSLVSRTVTGGLADAYRALAGIVTPASNGPVGRWTFDEGSGAVAHDSAGNHDASLVGGATWSSGRLGSALSFAAGGGGHAVVADDASLRFDASQSFTLSAWVSAGPLSGGWEGVVTKGRDHYGWYGIWIANGQWVVGSESASLYGPQVTPGWHQLTVVQDGAAGTRTLYVDGVAAVSGAASYASGPGDLWVGGAAGVDEYFAGSVDDVRVYARALSASEVGGLANPPATTTPTAPTDLTVTAVSQTQVTLSWANTADDGTGFKVERSTNGNYYIEVGQPASDATTFQDAGLTAGQTYYYRVRATNSVGDSGGSNVVTARTTDLSGLASRWAFDEGSGPVARDSSGAVAATLVGGATWSSGRLGSALSFAAGGGGHAVVADDASLRFDASQSFTLSAWVSAGPLSGGWEGVVTKGRDHYGWYGIWISGGRWVVGSDGGNLYGPQVTPGWHQVALVQDGAAGTRTLYVDGVAAVSGAASYASGPGDLWVGGAAGVDEYFAGSVDDVRVYARALSASEVGGLANPPATTTPTAPTDLAAVAVSRTQIDLSWIVNSKDQTGFKIWRSTDGVNFTQVGQVDAGVTVFQDTGLNPAQTYVYRVRATNAAGDSDDSNRVAARTQSEPGLIGDWTFDDGEGPSAHDTAGVNDGTLHDGATWTTGRTGTGSAVTFAPGSGGHVVVADDASLRFDASQSFTLSAWVLVGDPSWGWHGVVTKGRDHYGWYGIWIADGRWVAGSDGGNLYGTQATSGWHQVTLVQDGAAGTRTLYVDGVAAASGAAAYASGRGDLWVGGAAGVDEYFAGSVDDLRVYDRALSDGEIKTLAGD